MPVFLDCRKVTSNFGNGKVMKTVQKKTPAFSSSDMNLLGGRLCFREGMNRSTLWPLCRLLVSSLYKLEFVFYLIGYAHVSGS